MWPHDHWKRNLIWGDRYKYCKCYPFKTHLATCNNNKTNTMVLLGFQRQPKPKCKSENCTFTQYGLIVLATRQTGLETGKSPRSAHCGVCQFHTWTDWQGKINYLLTIVQCRGARTGLEQSVDWNVDTHTIH